VNGGRRIEPGHWPATAPRLFDRSNSVVTLHQAPVTTNYQPIH
jgi:hypothetical protein